MLKYAANNKIANIFIYEVNHLGPNAQFALYRTMNTEQWVFLLIFTVLSYPLYLGNKKLTGFVLDKLLFSEREFKDE